MLTYGASLCDETNNILYSKLLKVVSKHEVITKVKREFRIDGDFYLEYLFSPMNMFMRVDSPSDLPDTGQLKIIPVLPTHRAGGAEDAVSLASTVPVSEVSQLGSSIVFVEP